MHRFSLLSEWFRASLPGLLFLLVGTQTLMASCAQTSMRPFSSYSEYAVMAADERDAADTKWAQYLKQHWQKRATDKNCVLSAKAQDDSQLQLTVDVDGSMKEDFSVTRSPQGLTLKARTEGVMLWLQYQFMSAAAEEDARFEGSDLPPAMLSCRRDTAGTFAFEYRGIYSPSNADADMMPILGTHNVDFDWGLWGHNLRKIFTDGTPTASKALVNGERSNNQYCFSSESTYKAYEAYVIDQYGPGTPDVFARFAVMPNDNGEVCLCPACRALGNTPQSATPAVTRLVERLAKRFPNHQFFTSAYSTTLTPPSKALPENVGVLVSALSLPLKADIGQSGERKSFENAIASWQKVCRHIYVWDYMRNFDDYFTPYPCLRLLQSRLQYLQSLGVKGVFFNGSGYDYASFDDLQTTVLAGLMINPRLDIDQAVAHFFQKRYPVTAQLLTDYYLKIEDKAAATGLQPYAGIAEAAKCYLDAKEFETFWTRLDQTAKKSSDEERKSLNQLLTALNFTRLELLRLQPSAPSPSDISQRLELLAGHKAFKAMDNYREAYGATDEYMAQWRDQSTWLKNGGDRLRGASIKSLTPLDEEYTDLTPLTDGRLGFTSDYHTQWVLNSAPAWTLQIPADAVTPSSVTLSFLDAPAWHIYAPASVEVWQSGKMLQRVSTPQPSHGRALFSFNLTAAKAGQPLEVRIRKAGKAGRVTTACDEIFEGDASIR